MVIKVFGATYFARTQSVLFALEKLSLSYEMHSIDMQNNEHRASDFIASHHPFGKIPAIQDDDFKLFESRAIARYLVSKCPGPLSLPIDSASLGRFEEAASVECSYFEPAVSSLAWEMIFKKSVTGQEADLSVVAGLEKEVRQSLDYYEKVLGKQEWLGGSVFSLIEVSNAPWFSLMSGQLGFGKEIESRPLLKAW
ncbi:hypothetical protein AA0116_g16 [Alternaria tenuissima]|nr:hypothetical protein AA0116_g16 [Alternaria tenuissima]